MIWDTTAVLSCLHWCSTLAKLLQISLKVDKFLLNFPLFCQEFFVNVKWSKECFPSRLSMVLCCGKKLRGIKFLEDNSLPFKKWNFRSNNPPISISPGISLEISTPVPSPCLFWASTKTIMVALYKRVPWKKKALNDFW